ncbi:Hypothetical_protein [Hexamita inflata]|uniref:Hypothetical_protein n=1 Tax=Hexamita inflata TaxID=28002 RepID=A0AA86UPF2_9EUKA|nr:Hypothetical protein HINF_LOCUS54135 [Hexamita inflata]
MQYLDATIQFKFKHGCPNAFSETQMVQPDQFTCKSTCKNQSQRCSPDACTRVMDYFGQVSNISCKYLEYSKTVSGCEKGRIYYSANVLVIAWRMDPINPQQVLAKLLILFF